MCSKHNTNNGPLRSCFVVRRCHSPCGENRYRHNTKLNSYSTPHSISYKHGGRLFIASKDELKALAEETAVLFVIICKKHQLRVMIIQKQTLEMASLLL